MESSLVVIPTYNESDNLAPLVSQVMDLPCFRVLVVDDNSPDGTGDLAEDLRRQYRGRVQVLHRPAKLGLGTAYVEGFRVALQGEQSYIFQMDADFSHDPRDLPRLLGPLHRGADLSIGSRYVAGGATRGWPLWRLVMSRLGSVYAAIILGLPIRDVTGGYRGWRRQTLENIGLETVRSEGYAFQLEMAYRCARRNGRIAEIPILFSERRRGSSKMSTDVFMEAVTAVWRLRLEDARLPRMLRQVLVGR